MKVPQSLRSSDLYLRAVTAIFHYQNSDVMRVTRRKEFQPTPAEVAYWQRIHDLNQAEKTEPKPAPVYIVTTVEMIQEEVCDG